MFSDLLHNATALFLILFKLEFKIRQMTSVIDDFDILK